mgnify:CR=1 FL=1
MVKTIFIDSNILIQQGQSLDTTLLARVRDLVAVDLVEIVTVDISTQEVAKHFAEHNYKNVSELFKPRTLAILKETFGIELPEYARDEVFNELFETRLDDVTEAMHDLCARILSTSTIDPKLVFDDYARRTGFFAEAAKKDQFGDAFIAATLGKVATAQKPITIISSDRDFQILSTEDRFDCLNSLEELFDILGFSVPSPELPRIFQFLSKHLELHLVPELEQWAPMLVSDVEDFNDIDLKELACSNYKIGKIHAFRSANRVEQLLVVGNLKVGISFDYEQPDWTGSFWETDKGDKIPLDTIQGTQNNELYAKFSLLLAVLAGGEPSNISEFSFRELAGGGSFITKSS